MTKMAEFDLCGRERLLESVTRNELAKLWENVLTDFQSKPSSEDHALLVEKIDEICDPCHKIAGGVQEHTNGGKIAIASCLNDVSDNTLLVITLEKRTLWSHFSQARDNAWCTSVGFKAATTATATQASIKSDGHVPPFSSIIASTAIQGIMGTDASTNTRSSHQDS